MKEEIAAKTPQTPLAYGLAMLLASIAVGIVGITFLTNAAGWWSYATGVIALIGATVLIYFGVKTLSRSK